MNPEEEPLSYSVICEELFIELEFEDKQECASESLQQYLQLQKKRLAENNLRMERCFDCEGDSKIISDRSSSELSPDTGDVTAINQRCYKEQVLYCRKFYRDDRLIFRKNRSVSMYVDTEITQKQSGEKYSISEKVTDFYTYYSPVPNEKASRLIVKIVLWAALAVGVLLTLTLTIFEGIMEFLFWLIIGALVSVTFLCFAWLLLALPYFLYLILLICITSPLYFGCGIHNYRLLKVLDEKGDFCSAFFAEKAVPLAKLIIMSPDGNCPYYTGPALGSEFSDIMDMRYRGSSKILSLRQEGELLELELRLYFVNTYLKGRWLHDRRSVVELKMQRSAPDQLYSPGLEGWTVTEIKKIK